MRLTFLVLACLSVSGCRDANPQTEAIRQRIDEQMHAFDELIEKHEVQRPELDEPTMESYGNSYNLDFLVGKRVEDFPLLFDAAEGPIQQRPSGICFREYDGDSAVVFFTWETNASQMTYEMAPSDRLCLAVRDGEIIGYCFDPYYLR